MFAQHPVTKSILLFTFNRLTRNKISFRSADLYSLHLGLHKNRFEIEP